MGRRERGAVIGAQHARRDMDMEMQWYTEKAAFEGENAHMQPSRAHGTQENICIVLIDNQAVKLAHHFVLRNHDYVI